jgi:hypothetical protein
MGRGPRTRLCGHARGCDGRIREELAQKLGVHASLGSRPRQRDSSLVSPSRNVPCPMSANLTPYASVELPTCATAAASSSLLEPSASVQ